MNKLFCKEIIGVLLIKGNFLLFKKEPLFFIPQYISFNIGLYITPNIGSFFTTKAIDIHTKGNPWTKLVVPSTGSITHEGLSVKIIFFDSLELTVS